ncbi:DMT family transporter [Longimicrobium terrae]|uniref:Drug/metabolite transporter (DMT)-like permease n=1 Tax=Longimicrobium terrae TaxID=1639882 RepID=A0A841GWP5_9BACT|nr:DMT family transporter [Longimicrobium terrae]MBB4634314.1 drug/metabolite transporter (DMT)-like permease [Longimicrobium terrae]MBB6068796.1 drug/metabolite transporter (DMT)-like permease [Longimicrobium terrae]NNC27981.1 DMT family transporter [Longimicrobium terrae]
MSSRSSVYVALVLVQVFFATLPIAVKVALRELSSPSLALIRVSGAALLFILIHQATVREKVRGRRDIALLAVYSLFGVILNQLLYITALTMTTATAAQTLVTAGPAMTLLIAIVLRHETATPMKWAGIALAAAGALLLVGVGVSEGRALGNVLALANVAAYSIYLVISRDLLRRYNALTVITWVFGFGVIGMLPWGLGPALREVGGAGRDTWLAMGWIILFPSVAAYYLNVWALARAEASLVSTFVYLQPMLTAALASMILKEHASARMIPAAVLIFAGVAVAIRAGQLAKRRESAAAVSAAGQEG